MAENNKMLDVFRESGFGITMKSEPGKIRIQFPTSMTPRRRPASRPAIRSPR